MWGLGKKYVESGVERWGLVNIRGVVIGVSVWGRGLGILELGGCCERWRLFCWDVF